MLVSLAVILSGCSMNIPQSTTAPGKTMTSGSLWRTADGGQNFEVKSKVDEKTSITKADILSIAYHPKKSGIIYVSTVDNGIFKTENGGEEWAPIVFPPKKIYSFILDKNNPDNRMFASGVLDNWGKIFRTDDGGENWEPVYTEPGDGVTVTALSQHFSDTNVIFAGTSAGTVVKSVDSGDTWKNIGSKIDGTVGDIAFDANKKLVTYLLTFGQKIYYSPDGGLQWLDWEKEKQEEIAALQKKMTKIAVSGKTESTANLQKQVQDLNNRNLKNKMPSGILSMATDPILTGVLYAGTSTGLFRSPDYGKYWYEVNIIESAKKFAIRSIAVNPKDSNEIVFVAGKAFYKSIDGGATWFVTGLSVDRGASFISYDPFDSKYLFLGLRNFK